MRSTPDLVREALPEVFPAYGISMTLPYLEPYLVRTMREALLFSKFIAQNAPQALEQGRALWPSQNLTGDWKEQLSLLAAIAKVYLPGYNPAKIPLPSNVAEHSASLVAQAREIRQMTA